MKRGDQPGISSPGARHSELGTRNSELVRGVVTVAQEDRIRVVDAAGRGYLFVVGKRVRRSLPELWALARDRRTVEVVYSGEPDLGAVAWVVRVEAGDGR